MPLHTEGRDDALLRRYSRVTGKDLLKCLRAIALQRGGPYEKSIARIYTQLRRYVPEHQLLAASLFALYRTPVPAKERILAALAAADKHLLHGHEGAAARPHGAPHL